MSASAAGQLYVLDSGRSRLIRFGADSSPTDSTGGAGSRLNAFLNPTDVDATHELAIYVADPVNGRIVRLDRQLQFVSEIRTGSNRVHRLASNPNGELFGLDVESGRLLKYRRNGDSDPTFPKLRFETSHHSDVLATTDDVVVSEGTRIRIVSRLGAELGFREIGSPVIRLARIDAGIAVLTADSLVWLDARYRELGRIPSVPGTRDVAVTPSSIFWLTRSGIRRQPRE